MSWNFWKKSQARGESPKTEKLTGPQDLAKAPGVGRDLIVKMHKDPDWVWHRLKCVVRRRENERNIYNFRVFDEAQAARAQVKVRDYTSLDDHPELTLFYGWFDKKTAKTQIEEQGVPEPITHKAA